MNISSAYVWAGACSLYGSACARGKGASRQSKSYRMKSISIIDARFVRGAGYARFLEISLSALETGACFAGYNLRIEKVQFLYPYDLFAMCAIRRSVDYKQVLFCFVLETGIQRTLIYQ